MSALSGTLPAIASSKGQRPMRIAWIGTPMDRGSVTYIATQLLERLPELGVEVDCYAPSVEENVPERLRHAEGLRFFFQPVRYQPGRWYSRTKLAGFVSGQTERAVAQALLAERIKREHAVRPYDCVYQISQLELFWLRALRNRLPPIVLHPHTHAAGELRWLYREKEIERESGPPARNAAVRAMMRARAEIQCRDIRLARMVVAPSARFADYLSHDYGFPRDRIAVVPNPIDLRRHMPSSGNVRPADAPQTILYISRISVRKGVEMIVRLSHQLSDLAGQVRIHVIGDHSAWSDYRPLLRDLNPDTASYDGYVPPELLASMYERADAVIQPSRFEPFGLTISEGLATGVPVVASTEVGAVDGVDPAVCRVFPDGDQEAFAAEVRTLLTETRDPTQRRRLGELARAEAQRLFAPDRSARALADALQQLSQLDGAENGRGLVKPGSWR